MPTSERRLHNDIKKAIKGKGIDIEKIQYLINKDSTIVNAKGKYGRYPLHVAVKYGKEDIANCLLDNGAEIDAKDSNGKTALHYAIKYFWIDAAKFLILRKADVNAKDYNDYTPLHIAQSNWFICQEVIHLLLDRGADINQKDIQGNTILHHAIRNYCCENVYYYHMTSEQEYQFRYQSYINDLLKLNANVNAKNNKGKTPLHLAVKKQYVEIVDVIFKHYEHKYSNDTISIMLSYGDNTMIKDDQNMPPIDSAKSRKKTYAINSLDDMQPLITEHHDVNTSYAIEEDEIVNGSSTIEFGLS